jgi:hypothetical protein
MVGEEYSRKLTVFDHCDWKEAWAPLRFGRSFGEVKSEIASRSVSFDPGNRFAYSRLSGIRSLPRANSPRPVAAVRADSCSFAVGLQSPHL